MAGVGKLLKQAQKMQKKMDALNQELAQKEIEVTSGGGAVTIRISLQQEVKSLKIDPEFLKEDAQLVEETLLEAIKQAITKSREQQQEAINEVTSGFSMPGLM